MWPDQQGEGWPSWTFSNHDAPRAVSRWAQGRDRKAFAEMALLLLVCLRGNVFVYQGEELGLPQAEVPFERLVDPEAIANWPETLGRDGARTPMPWHAAQTNAGFSTVEPWLPVDPRHLPLAVDAQEADPASTLQVARRMIGLRPRASGAAPRRHGADRDLTPAGLRASGAGGAGNSGCCASSTWATRPPTGARPPDATRIEAINWTEADGAGPASARRPGLQPGMRPVSRHRSRARSDRSEPVPTDRRSRPRGPAVWTPSAVRPSSCPGRWWTGPGASSG
jgi:alpha-glucosidase